MKKRAFVDNLAPSDEFICYLWRIALFLQKNNFKQNFINQIMKNFFFKAAMLLVMPLMAASFVSCDDDNNSPAFQSELIGEYTPAARTMTIPGVVEEPADFYFVLNPTWTKDPSTILVGGFLPINTVVGLMDLALSNIVKEGLSEVSLKNDGSLAAKYHDPDFSAHPNASTDMNEMIAWFLESKFKPEVKVFPSVETDKIMPANAVGYYTNEATKTFYFTVSKDLLKQTGNSMEQPMDIVALLDTLISELNLDIVSTPQYFGIPLKYREERAGVTELYVDRAMMLPFVELLKVLPEGTLPSIMGISLDSIINGIFDNSSEVELGIFLQKK